MKETRKEAEESWQSVICGGSCRHVCSMEWDARNMTEHISTYKNVSPSQFLATEEERKKLAISLSLPPVPLKMKNLEEQKEKVFRMFTSVEAVARD
ncbi:hypothetical protein MUK42_18719 [Musa troglodytarum]|uniref:Uncharacterized protein n=1 Tax=Musa troglodytarum TaxID=320322 RepID=A0A9E7FG90_9LILI|nr:hypothetical protein MUK42_18719 [Musa troglodytarum]